VFQQLSFELETSSLPRLERATDFISSLFEAPKEQLRFFSSKPLLHSSSFDFVDFD
jgi:hypothetical protein